MPNKKNKQHEKNYHSLLVTFENIIEKNGNNNGFIHDKEKYGAIAIWTLLNKTTLGNLVFMYNSLNTQYKKKLISYLSNGTTKPFKITSPKLGSWLEVVNYIRNLAAHSAKVYHEPLKKWPKLYEGDPEDKFINKDKNPKTLAADILVFRRFYLMMSDERKQFWNSLIDKLEQRFNREPFVDSKIIGIKSDQFKYLRIDIN